MKATSTTNALLAIIATCLLWLCVQPLPDAVAQTPRPPSPVVIVGYAAPKPLPVDYAGAKPLPVDLALLAGGKTTNLPVKVVGSSGALPVRLTAVGATASPLSVSINGAPAADGALPVRPIPAAGSPK